MYQKLFKEKQIMRKIQLQFQHKAILKFVFKLLVTIMILIYLEKSNLMEMRKMTMLVEMPFVILGMILAFILISTPLISLRWWSILNALALPIPYKAALSLSFIGVFFSTIIPGVISGDIVKGMYLHKIHPKKSRLAKFISLLIDRVLGLYGLLILTSIIISINMEQLRNSPSPIIENLSNIILILTAVLFIGMLAIFIAGSNFFILYNWLTKRLPMKHFWISLKTALNQIQTAPKTIFLCIFISMGHHLIFISCYLVFLYYLVPDLPSLVQQVVVISFGLIFLVIPFAPAGKSVV